MNTLPTLTEWFLPFFFFFLGRNEKNAHTDNIRKILQFSEYLIHIYFSGYLKNCSLIKLFMCSCLQRAGNNHSKSHYLEITSIFGVHLYSHLCPYKDKETEIFFNGTILYMVASIKNNKSKTKNVEKEKIVGVSKNVSSLSC